MCFHSLVIIRKKPLNKMVQTNDHDTVDDNSDAVSMTKSSNSSTLFTPRSVYSHTTIPNVTPDSKKLDSISRKSNSPLSPPHMVKNLSFFIPTSSKDASVQVGDPPEQMKKIAKVMPFPVSPPATKPVARVSPQPQNISPPVLPTPSMKVVEEKAKNKDKIEAKSPEAERHAPLKSPPPISSVITPTVAATSPSNNITNSASTRAATATSSTPPLKTSPVTKSFPSKSCSPQLPISSDTPLVSEQANTNSTVSASDTGATTTDGETVRIKKKKKKKHHSTAEHSGQEGGGVEHKKKKKKKQKKEHKEHDNGDEPRKKKKKVKHADKEGVWIEKEATPVATSAKKSPLKSPVPPSPTVTTPISHDPKDTTDEQVAKESVKEEPIIDTPLPSKRRPSLPGDTPVPSQNNEETKIEIENKLRPFLLSYYSSSGSDCSSPTIEERELDDHKTITTSPSTTATATTTTTDDVFTKEQCTKGMVMVLL